MPARDNPDIRLIEGEDADPAQLSKLLELAFSAKLGRFFVEHAAWMHRGTDGRYVAAVDGVYAGYRSLIPARCAFGGQELTAVWAMALYVLPEFRGLGLQRLLDARVLEAAPLRMSFPGALGASIYAKQGYGVREDLWEWHMPFAPLAYWRGRRAGLKGRVRQLPAALRAHRFLTTVRHDPPRRTEVVDPPDLALLEEIFRGFVDPGCMTTVRDAEYLRWRYLEAPYRDDLAFYVTRREGRPTHYAIVRHGRSPSRPARVLDLFGDFEDLEGLVDVLSAVILDAFRRGQSHVSLLVTSTALAQAARTCGFFAINPYRFRWSAEDPGLHARLSTAPLYWTLGDSDNDLQSVALF